MGRMGKGTSPVNKRSSDVSLTREYLWLLVCEICLKPTDYKPTKILRKIYC